MKRIWLILLVLTICTVTSVFGAYTALVATNMREAFLVASGYDRVTRPTDNTEVKVKLNLLSIEELNPQEQTLSFTGRLSVAWVDPRLGWATSSYDFNTIHYIEGEIWRPELVIENTASAIKVIADPNMLYRVSDTGWVVWEPPLTVTTRCASDLTYFPFDEQTCSITLSSWSHVTSETTLKALSDTISTQYYVENSEWILSTTTSVQETEVTEQVNLEDRAYSKLVFNLKLKRRSSLYGLNIFVPLIVLSLLSVLAFAFPPQTGEKTGFCIIVVLAIIVLYAACLDYLPAAKSVSLLAVYVAFVLILAMLAVVCQLIVLKIFYYNAKEKVSPSLTCVTACLAKITCKSRRKSAVPKDEILYKEADDFGPRLTDYVNGSIGKGLPPPKTKLPPVDSTLLKRNNKVRPKSDSSVKNVKTVNIRSPSEMTHADAAVIWDRFFFLLFLVIGVVVHFSFLCALAIGGS